MTADSGWTAPGWGVKLADPLPWPLSNRCCTASWDHWLCTLPAGHEGRHIAGADRGTVACAAWPGSDPLDGVRVTRREVTS